MFSYTFYRHKIKRRPHLYFLGPISATLRRRHSHNLRPAPLIVFSQLAYEISFTGLGNYLRFVVVLLGVYYAMQSFGNIVRLELKRKNKRYKDHIFFCVLSYFRRCYS